MTGDGLPVVQPPFDGSGRSGDDEQSTVVGVVLAAGTSSRFGDANKLLAEWDDAPLVAHATRTVVRSTVDAVVVVVGDEAERVRAAIGDLAADVSVVRNDRYAAGQGNSVRRGVDAARERDADAVVFVLGDMPTVDVESVSTLVAAFHAGVGDALAAGYRGVRGNPVAFGARHFDALSTLTGDVGGRSILVDAETAALVETGDPGVLVDVDRPEDLEDLGDPDR